MHIVKLLIRYLNLSNKQLDKFITAGRVLNSFGLNGQVKIDVYLEDLKLLKTVKVFLLGASLLKKKINFLKNTKKSTWIAAISEVQKKEQADQLRGQLIFLEKKYLPSLMTDEFYYEELKGLQINIDGRLHKGFVKDVFNFGSGEVLEVSLDDSGTTRYIPFDSDNVGEIDLANRTIILTPLKGLLS